MNKLWLFSALLLLTACGAHPVTPAPSASKIATNTPTPIFTPLQPTQSIPTATSEPVIRLTKLREWNTPGEIAWFSDSSRFAILLLGTDEQSVTVYHTESLTELLKIPLSQFKIYSGVAVNPENRQIVVFSGDEGLKIFNAGTGELMAQKPPDDNCFPGILADQILFTDLQHFIVGFNRPPLGLNGPPVEKEKDHMSVMEWNTSPLTCLGAKITQPVGGGWPTNLNAMRLSPDYTGLTLIASHTVSGVEQGLITVWDVMTFKQKCFMPGIYADFRPSDNLLAVVDTTTAVLTYWDVDRCAPVRKVALPQYEHLQEIAFTSDGKYLITRRDRYQVWNADTGDLIYESELLPEFGINFGGSLKISPDEQYLFSTQNGRDGNRVILWKIERP